MADILLANQVASGFYCKQWRNRISKNEDWFYLRRFDWEISYLQWAGNEANYETTTSGRLIDQQVLKAWEH
jgi:hypothetical protein